MGLGKNTGEEYEQNPKQSFHSGWGFRFALFTQNADDNDIVLASIEDVQTGQYFFL